MAAGGTESRGLEVRLKAIGENRRDSVPQSLLETAAVGEAPPTTSKQSVERANAGVISGQSSDAVGGEGAWDGVDCAGRRSCGNVLSNLMSMPVTPW